jgi:CheY-like chemotaxis protein
MKKITVLVAEDEEINFMLIKALLPESDFNISRAHDGEKAVELFLNSSKFDIILMDIKMPVMTGFEATAKIREHNKHIPIIAQTGYSYKREDCIKAGFTDFMSKPFKKDQLLDMIACYISKP